MERTGAGASRDAARSEPFRATNLLDRLTRPQTRRVHDRHVMEREVALLAPVLPERGEVLSVGAGWNPGRHLFPAPAWRMVAVDSDPVRVAGVLDARRADEAFVGEAGRLSLPAGSFDAVLYRLVLHHIAYQGPLGPCFAEAARLLRPDGLLVCVEPGVLHPIGAALAAANHLRLATSIHGTPDDIPLAPRSLLAEARAAGLKPALRAVTYTWRRLPVPVQRALQPLDRSLGARARAAPFGHTLLLVARKPR